MLKQGGSARLEITLQKTHWGEGKGGGEGEGEVRRRRRDGGCQTPTQRASINRLTSVLTLLQPLFFLHPMVKFPIISFRCLKELIPAFYFEGWIQSKKIPKQKFKS